MAAAPLPGSVATRDEQTRADFLLKVYQHLGGAIIAFVLFEALLFNTGAAEKLYEATLGSGGRWLLVLGLFMVGSWIATTASQDVLNPSRQYAGLFGMAALEALIFAPFLHAVFNEQENGSVTVGAAVVVTGIGFVGLTAVGLLTRKDLSFLRGAVLWGGVMAFVLIIAALLFGLELGVWFSLAMIGLMGAAILYKTQQILRTYPEEAYVGAAVQLFASLMTMFWYVLRLFSRR
jgi:uncharacterized protein